MPQQSRIERSGLIDVGQMPGVGNDVDGRAGNQILQRLHGLRQRPIVGADDAKSHLRDLATRFTLAPGPTAQ